MGGGVVAKVLDLDQNRNVHECIHCYFHKYLCMN